MKKATDIILYLNTNPKALFVTSILLSITGSIFFTYHVKGYYILYFGALYAALKGAIFFFKRK